MTKVAILPIPGAAGGLSYHAVAGDKHSEGSTAGQALDALEAQLPQNDSETLVIIQKRRPDRFFNAAQQQRLAELMSLWRSARDKGSSLPPDQQAELEGLVDAELRASAARTAALADESGR